MRIGFLITENYLPHGVITWASNNIQEGDTLVGPGHQTVRYLADTLNILYMEFRPHVLTYGIFAHKKCAENVCRYSDKVVVFVKGNIQDERKWSPVTEAVKYGMDFASKRGIPFEVICE